MLPVVKETALLGLDIPVGLILLYTVYGLSFNIFIFVAYINSIPVELEEAARLDGASTWMVFREVTRTPRNGEQGPTFPGLWGPARRRGR
jgi:raffinose/stachyose/melibiose transport system permease protein